MYGIPKRWEAKINRAYPSCYGKKYQDISRGTTASARKTSDWDDEVEKVRCQESERKHHEDLISKRLQIESEVSDKSKASGSKELTRAEATKNDPNFLSNEKERKERHKKLRRQQKIKSFPNHISPSAALRQAAKIRRDQQNMLKVCPPRPRPPPVSSSYPRHFNDISSKWHPPPPPVKKRTVFNPIENKRQLANESIVKREVLEKNVGVYCKDTGEINTEGLGDVEGHQPLSAAMKSFPVSEHSKEGGGCYVLTDREVENGNLVAISQHDVRQDSEDFTEDEKIWKEIFGSDAKIPTDADDDIVDIKAEMNSVLAQNFFIFMWTTLEDLFSGDVISWMCGVDINPMIKEEESSKRFAEFATNDDISGTAGDRKFLNTNSQSVAHSLAILLERAVQQAEKCVALGSLFTTEMKRDNLCPIFSAEDGLKYHRAKQTLLSSANIRRCNPHFNSTQWSILGLLLVDALIMKKVFHMTDSLSSHFDTGQRKGSLNDDDERVNVWNAQFSIAISDLVGGETVLDSLLESREIENLRHFFVID